MGKRAARLLMIVLLPMLCIAVLSGCKSVDKKALLETAAESDLTQLKHTLQSEDTADYLDADVSSSLETYGVDAAGLITSVLSVFDYRIENVVVDDSAGTVTVEITVMDLATVLSDWYGDMSAWITSSDGVSAFVADKDAALKNVGTMLMEAVQSDDAPTTSATVELDYAWNDATDTWTLETSQEDVAAMVTSLLGLDAAS